jgi:hypothetical protein
MDTAEKRTPPPPWTNLAASFFPTRPQLLPLAYRMLDFVSDSPSVGITRSVVSRQGHWAFLSEPGSTGPWRERCPVHSLRACRGAAAQARQDSGRWALGRSDRWGVGLGDDGHAGGAQYRQSPSTAND